MNDKLIAASSMIWMLIYNLIKRPFYNWRFRRKYLADWLAEGRDPDDFPRLAPITRADVRWARHVLNKSPFNL